MPPRSYHPPMRLPIPTFFAFATLMLMGSLSAIAQTPSLVPTPPQPRACPAEVPAESRCYTGEDGQGAFYWIALPAQWDRGVLVMHAHGGPADTGPAKAERATEDLQRWAITVKAGYAWAGSTYRRGGYGITMAAEDTERLRTIFVQHFGPARRTILHGQSYGGGVASKAAELYASVDDRPGPYDGVLLTSGVLGGGSVAYDFRLDLRVVYQWVCQNHPKADEPQYPLWRGLPMDAKLTRAELAERVDACTGVRKPVAQRTEQQKANLATILNAIRIPEGSLIGHLNWATWLFRDLVQLRLDGRNPFGNVGAVAEDVLGDVRAAQHVGSIRVAIDERDQDLPADARDVARRPGVVLEHRDPVAVAALARDSAPTGQVRVPVLTLHAIHDPTAFVELESAYRETLEGAGQGERLVQTFSEESEHSYLGDAQYPALFAALTGVSVAIYLLARQP